MTEENRKETGSPKVAEARAGKYLTFQLGEEIFGLEILKVQEIIGVMKVTRVPRMPDFIRGVINLRGKVIPVVELRLKFGLPAIRDTDKTCIIVLQLTGPGGKPLTMGIIVDEVSEVLEIMAENIEPPPSFGTSVDVDFILGMGKAARGVIILLNIDKILTEKDIIAVKKAGERGSELVNSEKEKGAGA